MRGSEQGQRLREYHPQRFPREPDAELQVRDYEQRAVSSTRCRYWLRRSEGDLPPWLLTLSGFPRFSAWEPRQAPPASSSKPALPPPPPFFFSCRAENR